MSKVLTFQVGIEGLENKIWRKIEIIDSKTVADLAYTILASFDSLAYHLYKIEHGEDTYDCMVDPLEVIDNEYKSAVKTKLQDVDFSNNRMIMEYDFGSTTTFIITYLESNDLKRGTATHYPYVIEGAGSGMLDDITSDELKSIVEDIDYKGYSDYEYTPGYDREENYDYRDYDIEFNNKILKSLLTIIKRGYEMEE